jgi:hypothetical protein
MFDEVVWQCRSSCRRYMCTMHSSNSCAISIRATATKRSSPPSIRPSCSRRPHFRELRGEHVSVRPTISRPTRRKSFARADELPVACIIFGQATAATASPVGVADFARLHRYERGGVHGLLASARRSRRRAHFLRRRSGPGRERQVHKFYAESTKAFGFAGGIRSRRAPRSAWAPTKIGIAASARRRRS